MFGSFIVGILFGLGSKYVTGPISEFVSSKVSLSEKEMAIVAFGAVMLVASLVASLLTGNASPFWLILGGTIGVFGFQLFDFAKGRVEAAKASGQDVIEDAQDAASDAADTVSEKAEKVAETVSEKAGDAAETAQKAVKKTVKKATKS